MRTFLIPITHERTVISTHHVLIQAEDEEEAELLARHRLDKDCSVGEGTFLGSAMYETDRDSDFEVQTSDIEEITNG